ncbi:125 kDa kinesin-related protein-like [Dorcoceras hygrometricum]|uniref:125 kDa kinesin-related protein-like n=1 Tax=Dorcoceras hygrometricum TaxID=472368 RepID=A0A2Z7DKG8_9LAMI|nr:125 kDa kinesin-related protein-like [Dorcoceras hygrometricum]
MDDRYRRDEKKEDRYKREDNTDERSVDRSKERSKDRRMRTRSDRRPNRKNDRKVLVAEESTKSWADTDSESSSSSSSSSDSEQEEVHCFMSDQTSDDEVFYFSNVEFTREDLVSALNDMVKEYRKLSHSFEEAKAENISLKSSSIESSSDELEDIDSLKIELSKLAVENKLLRSESSELTAEVEKLTKEMSSWNQSARALHKLEGETSTQSQSAYDKFNKMSFVKANVIYDCFESITFDDQNSPKLKENGKASIGFQRPENSKPSWLKNKLDKDKAKAGSKSFVPNQPRRNSRKNSPKLKENGKASIGFQRPENSKPSWLKNKLDKDKAKAGSKSFVPNQPRRNSRKPPPGAPPAGLNPRPAVEPGFPENNTTRNKPSPGGTWG